jgi:hypothetical protein
MKSASSGKAGGLREREPLKAPSTSVVRDVCLLFSGGFHDFQVLHRLLLKSLLI